METGANAHRRLPQYQHTARLTLLPIPRLSLRMAGEYNTMTLEPGHVHEDVFFDCEARYSFDKVWEVSFDGAFSSRSEKSDLQTFSDGVPLPEEPGDADGPGDAWGPADAARTAGPGRADRRIIRRSNDLL